MRLRLLAWLRRTPALLAFVAFPVLAASVIEVGIQNHQFAPAEIEIKVGGTVKWINKEKRTSHSVLFSGEGSRESERLFPGESWERAFEKPGIYPYICGPHPEMKGVIKVIE